MYDIIMVRINARFPVFGIQVNQKTNSAVKIDEIRPIHGKNLTAMKYPEMM